MIVKLTKSPTLALPVKLETLTRVKLTTGLTVTLVLLETGVSFSFELAVATFSKVPLVKTLTTTHTETLVPLFNLAIVQVTLPLDSTPFELSYSNAGSKTSLTLTSVALEGPLLVTVTVKLTKSPTLALPVKLETLTRVKLTTGSTVTLVLFDLLVVFSLQLTVATFSKVPLVKTLTTTQTEVLVPLFILSIVQVTLLLALS